MLCEVAFFVKLDKLLKNEIMRIDLFKIEENC